MSPKDPKARNRQIFLSVSWLMAESLEVPACATGGYVGKTRPSA
jgi:hypothetical protein